MTTPHRRTDSRDGRTPIAPRRCTDAATAVPRCAEIRRQLGRSGCWPPPTARTGRRRDGDRSTTRVDRGRPRLPAAARRSASTASSAPQTYRRSTTPAGGSATASCTHRPGHLLTGDDVLALQQRLLDLGFDVGRVDGLFGPRDRARAARVPAQRRACPPTAPAARPRSRRSARLAPHRAPAARPHALRAEERIRTRRPARWPARSSSSTPGTAAPTADRTRPRADAEAAIAERPGPRGSRAG